MWPFKKVLKTTPNLGAFGYKECYGDWFGDGFKEVCGLLELPLDLQQRIYNNIQPLLEFGNTAEVAQKLIRNERELISRADSWGGGTDRQVALMFCHEVLSRSNNIKKYREWLRRSKSNATRGKIIYGMLSAIDDRDPGICSRYKNIILPFGHPSWKKYYPSHRIGCKCSVILLSDTGMERRGLSVTLDANLPI